jgi:hypothetical protein
MTGLQKQPVNFNFSSGLDTKSDPFQIPIGKFFSLENSIFTKNGLLQKRNGYKELTSLPDSTSTYVTTFNGNLTSISTSLNAYASGPTQWINRGAFQPLVVNTLSLIRNSTNQTQVDSVIASNGLICTVYTDVTTAATLYRYAVADSVTGQNIISPTAIIPTSGTVSNGLRVFILAGYFVIVYSTSTNHLQYIRINISNPTAAIETANDVTTSYTGVSTVAFDGIVVNNTLYLAWNGNDGGGAIRMTYYDSTFTRGTALSGTNVANAKSATIMSVCADTTNPTPIIWVSFYTTTGTVGYSLAVNQVLSSILVATSIIAAGTVLNITSSAENMICHVLYEVSTVYGYGAGLATNITNAKYITQAGSVSSATTVLRSVGLASKSFFYIPPVPNDVSGNVFRSVFSSGATSIVVNNNSGLIVGQILSDSDTPANIAPGTRITSISGNTIGLSIATTGNSAISPGDALVPIHSICFLCTYSSPYQPIYFLADISGNLLAKIAYSNGGGYLTLGLPSVTFINTTFNIPYLIKDSITPVNKGTNLPAGTQTAGIYAQTGINLAQFNFTSIGLNASEIGANLNLSGGFLRSYDGYSITEQGFHLWPDNVISTTATGAGSIAASTYFYIATYEWSDNQGNLFRSAPSIPISQVTTTASSTNTIKVPTLRLTAKTANPVKIVLYRWSLLQQVYYQVTSLTAPTTNDLTVDNVTITDTFSDATILGNSILYTTGGVVENIGAPSASSTTLFKSRLFLVDSEDPNLLWYSKKLIESTPVEMSDLFTVFVAPTISAQGNTGPITSLSAMDDKLIIGKKNAFYYLTGDGPDNTGANNDFSEPVFITSTVGCANQASIVFQPQGLMFQSDKGIWLLGRDLSTQYIGAPVELFTQNAIVQSALAIPETNQVRFTLDSGITLVYDYFYGQWGTFVGVPAISSTLYQDLHTFMNNFGKVFQESPGNYLDGSSPVTMSFTTGWLNMSGLQGFQRAYRYNLLGQYLTPHILTVSTAYDYNSSPSQISTITPDNFSGNYGNDPLYGDAEFYGGQSNVEQWRIDLEQQKCEAVQITVQESYDASMGAPAGAGLTLSGVNVVYGAKSTYPRLKVGNQVG